VTVHLPILADAEARSGISPSHSAHRYSHEHQPIDQIQRERSVARDAVTASQEPTIEDGSSSIEAALTTWDRAAARKRIDQFEALRLEFVERFPISAWPTLPLESYALGQQTDGGTVSWWLEFHTRALGSISGGSARKHFIWRATNGEWRYQKEYPSAEAAWNSLRTGVVEMLQLAAEERFDEVDDIQQLAGGVAVRSKLLYMYFPDALLPVASKAHVDHFLRSLGEPATNWSAVRANRHLLGLLRAQPGLKDFGTQELGQFVYHWADPRDARRVVKIAPGEQAAYWKECLDGSYICVGWDDVGDLSQYPDKQTFRASFAEHYPYNGAAGQVSRKANELWTLMELEPGDKVVANRGTAEVLAIGTVTEDGYTWRPDRDEYRHTLGVSWDTSLARSIEPEKAWATTTVSKVSAELYKRITGAAPPPRTVSRLYREVEEALERRGQVILYGPPGTGKTYSARRAAIWWLDGSSANSAAAAVLSDDEEFARRERHYDRARNQGRVWFMTANPSEWSWQQLAESGSVEFRLGRLKRNYPAVRAGDLVIGYESTPVKRVTAIARMTGEFDPDGPPEAALSLEHVSSVPDGFTYNDLQSDPILAQSEPARFRCQGTLFELTAVEADRALALLIGSNPSLEAVAGPSVQRLTRVTFHPSYTYEDFVEGYRPRSTGNAGLELSLSDGVFKVLCSAASADPDHRYVLLIDEINRGNIPKIFGELITIVEKDKRGLTIKLPQSGDALAVPPNLAVIGTMNTADRSIHLLDTALRRRFGFIELLPDSQLLAGATAGALALDVFLDSLNEKLREPVGREKQIGHAFFYEAGQVVDAPEAFGALFRHELLPLLQEYLYEDYRELAQLLGTEIVDVTAQRPTEIVDDPESLCLALAAQFGAKASA
jgi:5-methylcytosine-specific restriction protein B